jgi:MoaA/NifB/PqqE/SkfB family radical SAM enzyme
VDRGKEAPLSWMLRETKMMTTSRLHNLFNKLRDASLWMRNLHSYNPHTRRTSLRGPVRVQIQTIDRCNASCIMCPYSSRAKVSATNTMDDALYIKILKDLRQAGSVRSIMLMLQNEPLLDARFSDRFRLVKEVLGRKVPIGTVTNGAPLTPSMIDWLSTSGIDLVHVSIDAIREDTYARIRQGLNYQRVVGNTISLAKRLGSGRVSVRFLRQQDNEGEEQAFARFWRRQGINAVFMEPTNRAGSLQSYERIKKRHARRWQKLIYPVLNQCIPACPLPFSNMSILSDGRVILCCNDWEPHDIVGDLSEQTVQEVWNGEKMNHYRQLLITHLTKDSLVCADCSLCDHYWKI